MHNVEKTGKTFVSTETALASIAAHSQPALAEVIEQNSSAPDSSMKMVDITHTAISSAQCLGPELPKKHNFYLPGDHCELDFAGP